MAGTSGTYKFQSVQIELLIREAYERLGILGEKTEYQKMDSAKRSIDLILLDWMNKSVNLWTLKGQYLALITGKGQYKLDDIVNNIIQVNLRTSTRQLNGTASSLFRQLGGTPAASSGIAANAFDGNRLTACTQNAPNGDISYDYGAGNDQTITSWGLISQTTLNYNLNLQTSDDGINWVTLVNVVQQFTQNQRVIFDLALTVSARFYRIIETGGATLNIQELYFFTYSPNPNADNAFNPNSVVPFADLIPNGSISYDYGVNGAQTITFLGFQTPFTSVFSLTVEYSLDNVQWDQLLVIPSQTYEAGIISWFDVETPITARAYRIRETGGAILNFQNVLLNNNTYDFAISNVSRYEYLTYPNKKLQSRPSVYYFDRQIDPILNIWPTPSQNYNCLFYSYKQMMQDTGAFYTDTLDIPARFYPALIWGLCWQLALKYKPESAAMFKTEYDESFGAATYDDSENTAIRIDGDYTDRGIR